VTIPRLADVLSVLDAHYPPSTAESWDAVGLTLGDPEQRVQRVLFAVDPTPEVVSEAISLDVDLLVTHHPLFLRGVHGFAATTAKGRMATSLVRGGVALFTAHTNADIAAHGVSDALADALSLLDVEPLRATPLEQDKVVTFIPAAHVQRVADAMADVGAGTIGNYARCRWSVTGDGYFLPGEGAAPVIGQVGRLEHVDEARLEILVPRRLRTDVIRALLAAHPYEEVAYDVYELAGATGATGMGRVGRLPTPMRLDAFVELVAASLPVTGVGVRWAGEADRGVEAVAVMGGAGDSMFDAVVASGADVIVTADLRHHPVTELRQRGDVAVVDPGHFASEWPWLPIAAQYLVSDLAGQGFDLEALVSTLSTDPWAGVVKA
jgi:dinuclear metal center YbgI/SA1388 family protein